MRPCSSTAAANLSLADVDPAMMAKLEEVATNGAPAE
jgi:hypothetical protein